MSFNRFKWVYLIGFFLIVALPLLNLPPTFSPPDWGKTIVFRIIFSIMLFLFLWELLEKKNFSIKVSLPFLLLIALFLIFFLATIFSLDPYFSFWGSPYRAGGFLNFAFYIFFALFVFLILNEGDWQKIWDFAIFVGILVSLIAIFQWKGMFSQILIPFAGRPPSTLGGPIFLAIYLLLLSFPTLSFGLKTENLFKKFYYFFSFLFFIFVAIFITQTRAAIAGFVIGSLYFISLFPTKKLSLSLVLKMTSLIFLISGVFAIYFVNTQKEIPQFIKENELLLRIWQRISIERALTDARISGWRVSWEALKERSILGYGPENFAIAFNKYYDPSLPGLEMIPGDIGTWWDRAHNFFFDTAISAGVPALIIYLLLFGVLFWELQKLKGYPNLRIASECSEYLDSLISHGIQATFLAYLVANFFSFDTFSIYIITFLLIGYSLCLIDGKKITKTIPFSLRKSKTKILLFTFLFLVWFIWNFNLKPLEINKEIKLALYESEKKLCEKALLRMEKILPNHSFFDNYLRLQYITVIQNCAHENVKSTEELAKKATEVLKENIKIRPLYTRNWLLLGSWTNVLIEEGKKNLGNEANFYFEKAHQLSPKRQEVFVEWIKTDLLTEEYEKAKKKAQKCILLNPKLGECWWLMGLSEAFLKNFNASDRYIKFAQQNGWNTNSKDSLAQLTEAYIFTKNYLGLVKTYSKLISLDPQNTQYHASLAVVFRELGKIEEAKKEALKVLELQPEAREEVEKFLQSLK